MVTRLVFLPPKNRTSEGYAREIAAAGGVLTHCSGRATGHPIPIATYCPRSGSESGIRGGFGPPVAVILFSHGNGEDLASNCADMQTLANSTQCVVVAYEYTGYGPEKRRCSEAMVYNNIVDVYHHVGRTHADLQMVLVGYSLGTGPTCYLASLKPCRAVGVLLLAPFTSILAVPLNTRVKPPMPWDLFPNVQRLPKCEVPVQAVHGALDTVVQPWHSIEIQKATPPAFRRPVAWIPGIGHGVLCSAGRDIIVQFINGVVDSGHQ